jgi:ATP-binding cassette subfamily B protein/subfamily B ATP-binding cassette protein MsbA
MDEETNGVQMLPKEEILEIAFHQVSFRYEEKREILRSVSLSIRQGEKVAIIGTNGSGKTTILSLLLRFIHPKDGTITLNGADIALIDLDAYRSLFAVVSQEPYLFNDTVLNNISLCDITNHDAVEAVCHHSGAHSFIVRLPHKGDSMIGHNGAKLSGGEKQKLAVARALFKDAPIVILDEATSGYDVESNTYLHNVILNELGDKTVLMITHQYGNLEGMDRAYRLEDGVLFETNIMTEVQDAFGNH